MREIKFRAWKNKKMHYESPGWEDVDLLHGISTLDDYGYYVMQFTGLKDKNGKEIYEGDIVKFSAQNVVGLIEWDSRQVGFILRENERHQCADLGGYSDDAFEVIGSIYENPELLTQSK